MDKVMAETSTPVLPDGIDMASINNDEKPEATGGVVKPDSSVETAKIEETSKVEDAAPADGYTPVFSPRIRTVIYVLGVVISALAFILLGLAGEAGWPHWVSTLAGLIGTAYGVVASGFGVAYRPTK